MANVEWKETGHESPLARTETTVKMLDGLDDVDEDEMTEWENAFIRSIDEQIVRIYATGVEQIRSISPKQYFKLRDLYDKYCC